MASYTHRCSACDLDTDSEWPIGTAPRVTKCDCGRPARLVIGEGVNISATVTPSKSGDVLAARRRDRAFDRDGPAYKRMRHRGLQPEQIDGSAELENRVGDQDDIDLGRAIKVADENGGGGKARVLETLSTLEVTHGA